MLIYNNHFIALISTGHAQIAPAWSTQQQIPHPNQIKRATRYRHILLQLPAPTRRGRPGTGSPQGRHRRLCGGILTGWTIEPWTGGSSGNGIQHYQTQIQTRAAGPSDHARDADLMLMSVAHNLMIQTLVKRVVTGWPNTFDISKRCKYREGAVDHES